MVIISHKAIREFAAIHPNLLTALERWYAITTKADWRGFSDIKKQFNSVDAIGDGLFVFNIKGNDCRLISRIIFKTRTVFIRFIGIHKLTSMAAAIQDYEKVHYPFPMPKTLVEMVELKIFEKKINKVTLAKTLGIGTPKLSQILNGKRPPDISFLKAVHKKLGIDGNFILEAV